MGFFEENCAVRVFYYEALYELLGMFGRPTKVLERRNFHATLSTLWVICLRVGFGLVGMVALLYVYQRTKSKLSGSISGFVKHSL